MRGTNRVVCVSSTEDPIQRRLQAVRAAGFPVDPNEKLGETTQFAEAAKLAAPVRDWIQGKLDDRAILTRLFPTTLHFRYGNIGEEMEPLLTEQEKENLPQARLITDLWYAVLEQVDAKTRESFLQQYDEVGQERELGINAEQFRKLLKKPPKSGPSLDL